MYTSRYTLAGFISYNKRVFIYKLLKDEKLPLHSAIFYSARVTVYKVKVNLTFMEPRIARCVFYITNEMQHIQRSLLLSALYMFRGVFPPIIRSL